MTHNNNITDLDLSVTSRKKIRINGDDSRILDLNTSDVGIVTRLSDSLPKLRALQEKANSSLAGKPVEDEEGEISEEYVVSVSEVLKEVDNEMREIVDTIFNAPVSSVCAPDGSMYDPFNGAFRFEYIIDQLMTLMSDNLQKEFNSMEKKLKTHTAKYGK